MGSGTGDPDIGQQLDSEEDVPAKIGPLCASHPDLLEGSQNPKYSMQTRHKDYIYRRVCTGSPVSDLDAGPGKSGLGLGCGPHAGRIVLRHLNNPVRGQEIPGGKLKS